MNNVLDFTEIGFARAPFNNYCYGVPTNDDKNVMQIDDDGYNWYIENGHLVKDLAYNQYAYTNITKIYASGKIHFLPFEITTLEQATNMAINMYLPPSNEDYEWNQQCVVSYFPTITIPETSNEE